MLPRHDAGAHSACSPFCLRRTETAAGRFLPQKGSAGQAALHRCSSSARQAGRETTLPYLDSLMACAPAETRAFAVRSGREGVAARSAGGLFMHEQAEQTRGDNLDYSQ